MPSTRPSCMPVRASATNRKVTSRVMGMSRRRLERVTATGGDRGGQAQDEQGVEDVGTHHVADGDVGIALQGAGQADDQFRAAGAEAHDGQADDEFTDAGLAGDGGRTVHQPLGAEDDQRQARPAGRGSVMPLSILLPMRSRRQTFSTWKVWGNISTGWTSVILYCPLIISMSRACVAGLQLT